MPQALIIALLTAVSVGDKPAFDARAIDKTAITPKTLRNHIAVFYAWRMESESWRAALPGLQKFNAKNRPRGVELIGVNKDKDVKPLSKYLRDQRIVWPQIHAPKEFALLDKHACVLIGPKGAVRWAGELKDLDGAIQKALKEHPPKPTADQWRGIALSSLNGASRAMKDKDYDRAVAYLAQVNPEVRHDRMVQMTALGMASSFNVKGEDAKKLKAALKDYPEAGKFVDMAGKMSSPQLQAIAQQFMRNAPAKPRPRATMDQATRAAGRLKIAQRYAKGGKHHEAYRILTELVRKYAGSNAAAQAKTLIETYEADEKFKAAHADFMQDKQARSLMMMARNYLAAGKHDLARTKLQEVIDKFPKSKTAADARRELSKLR